MKYFMPVLMLSVIAAGRLWGCSDDSEFRPTATDLDADSDMDMDSDSDGDGDGDGDADADGDTGGDPNTDSDSSVDTDTDSNTDTTAPPEDTEPIAASLCLESTEDISHCEDCCDCVISDCTLLAACRSECAIADFKNNDELIVFDVPSDRGPDGDYQACFIRGDRQSCIECCDCAKIFPCGDYKYCRQVCDDIF